MSTTPETSPPVASADRILADTGGGFATGAVGGSVYHFVKGFKNSPPGGRLAGSLQAIRMNVPRIATRFGVWGGIFSACSFAMVFLLSKEDHPWNSIINAAGNREGASPSPAQPSSLPTPSPSLPDPPQVSETTSMQSSSWFGGLFGKKPE